MSGNLKTAQFRKILLLREKNANFMIVLKNQSNLTTRCILLSGKEFNDLNFGLVFIPNN